METNGEYNSANAKSIGKTHLIILPCVWSVWSGPSQGLRRRAYANYTIKGEREKERKKEKKSGKD